MTTRTGYRYESAAKSSQEALRGQRGGRKPKGLST